jgi:hypothetical protein
MTIKEEVLRPGGPADPGFLPTVYPAVLEIQRYLARSLVDGSPAAAGLFGQMVALTEQWVADGRLPVAPADPRAFAAALVAMQTGVLMLHEQVSQALGTDVLDTVGQIRLGRAIIDIYAQPLLTADQVAQAQASYRQIEDGLARSGAPGRTGSTKAPSDD